MAEQQSPSDGALLRRALAQLGRRMRRQDGTPTIGPTGLALLGLLHTTGPASITALAELEGLQPQSLTRALQGLERAGLIGRRPDARDRRRAMVWISPSGEELLRTTMQRRATWLNRAMNAHLNDDERETLRAAAALMLRLADAEQTTAAPSDQIFNLIPFTAVRDVAQSVAFYERFGFIVDGELVRERELVYASMRSRLVRSARIMFSRACEPIVPDAQRIHFYCWTDDIAGLHRRLREGGLSPSAITTPEYMENGEFTIVDPDGYRLMVGQVKRTS